MDSEGATQQVASFLDSLGTCQAHPASVFGTDWRQGPAPFSGLKPAHRDETGPPRLELDLSLAWSSCKGAKYSFL